MDNNLICAVCPTFNRPELLGRSIRSFEKQTYENRFLVIVDDLGQYENQKGDRWELISIPRRILTLGEKRNFVASLAPVDTWAYAVWDDDDLYMPWHLESIVEALHRGEFVQPRHAIDFWDGRWTLVETFYRPKKRSHSEKLRVHHNKRNKSKENRFAYHGCWGYTHALFTSVGGYRNISLGDDGEFQNRLLQAEIRSVDTSPNFRPSYFYNRQFGLRISQIEKKDVSHWGMNCENPFYIGKVPEWKDESIWDQEIPTEIIQRPW